MTGDGFNETCGHAIKGKKLSKRVTSRPVNFRTGTACRQCLDRRNPIVTARRAVDFMASTMACGYRPALNTDHGCKQQPSRKSRNLSFDTSSYLKILFSVVVKTNDFTESCTILF